MTNSTIGLIAGLLLAISIAIAGWFGFWIALVLGVIGYLAGGVRDGEIDVNSILRGRGRG